MGKGIRDAVVFLSATSLTMMMMSAVGLECHALGRDSGWGTASDACRRLSLGEDEAGSSAPFPWSGVRSDQPKPPGQCPAAGGATSNSNRRAGPVTKGYINSVWSVPRCLRRATSTPQRQHSLLGDPRESESGPSGPTRGTGIVPPGFYGRKHW